MCGDMMYSGHTYFVTVFAFGLFECTRVSMVRGGASEWKRWSIETLVTLAAVAQQSAEIYFVLKSRFHYTADIVMALIMTWLIFTNSVINAATMWWTELKTDKTLEQVHDEAFGGVLQEIVKMKQNEWVKMFQLRGLITLGCCCCSWSNQWVFDREDLVNMLTT